MYFNICNDVDIRNFALNGKRPILIRVLEPSYKDKIPYQINNLSDYSCVLELYIKDTVNCFSLTDNDFNDKTAKLLNTFILNHTFDEVVVHCSLGISRSPAIMICIAKILNNATLENIIENNFRNYNRYIVDVFENYDYKIIPYTDIEILGNVINKEEDKKHIFKKTININ